MEKSRRVEALRELLNKFGQLDDDNKTKMNDYAEGVKDALCAVNLISKI